MGRGLAALACAIAAMASGCGGEEILQPNVNVSVGQQLIDLKHARDSGALSAAEYEKQRTRLVRSVR